MKKKKILDSAPVFGITAGWVLWNSGKLFQFLHKGKNLEVVKSSVQATASLGVAGKATGEKKKFVLIFLGSVPVFGIAIDGCCEILEGCSSFHAWKKS